MVLHARHVILLHFSRGELKKMSNKQGNVTISLSKSQKRSVTIGCVMLMFSIAMFGLSLANLQGPILTSMNAMEYFTTIAILRVLPLSIMTPIGGKLGDLFGRRNVVIISGLTAVAAGVLMGIVRILPIYMACIVILSAAMGAFTAAPYIIAREINETKDVPKAMGLLSSAVAVGGFGGSIIAGIFQDMGYNALALMLPAIPTLIAIILIALNMPNVKREGKISIDYAGMILLTITLCGIILALNNGPKVGWANLGVIAGLIIGIIALVALLKYEGKAEEPIIPVSLLKNKQYSVLLIVGFLCYFYKTAMDTYAPLGIQRVFGGSTTISGSLQFPRTIVTMILPMILGAWVAKKTKNVWKAMAIATILVAVSFIALSVITVPGNSLMTGVAVYMIFITITGISESARAVAITPTAQSYLEPKDYGTGTAMCNFVNSLANPIAAALMGILYDIPTHNDAENVAAIAKGLQSVYVLSAISGVVGIVIVLLVVKKNLEAREK